MNIYIDESGSMTTKEKKFPFFVIGLVAVEPQNVEKLKRKIKRFVSDNMDFIRKNDKKGQMFDKSGKFIELKGSSMTLALKIKFLTFLCKDKLFNFFPVLIENDSVSCDLYDNTARAFNYVLVKALDYFISKNFIVCDFLSLSVDQRNLKTNSYCGLEDYLYLKLAYDNNYFKGNDIKVRYFESHNNIIIQLADFLSNVYYSHVMEYYHAKRKDTLITEAIKNYKLITKSYEFPWRPHTTSRFTLETRDNE